MYVIKRQSAAPRKLLQDPTVLRTRRLAAGLEQAELAKKAGCTQAAVSRLETGGRSARPSTLRMLARALECPVTELMAAEYRKAS